MCDGLCEATVQLCTDLTCTMDYVRPLYNSVQACMYACFVFSVSYWYLLQDSPPGTISSDFASHSVDWKLVTVMGITQVCCVFKLTHTVKPLYFEPLALQFHACLCYRGFLDSTITLIN